MPCKLIGEEVMLGFGKSAQADIETASADHLFLQTLETSPAEIQYQTSDDEGYTGKGTDFPTTTFKESRVVSKTFPFLCSAEVMSWLAAYAFGSFAESGAGDPYTYTAIPAVRGTDPCELPAFSLVQKDKRASALLDQELIGNAVAGFTLRVQSGPERANCTVDVDILGTGRDTTPSGVTLPGSPLAVTDLQAGSVALSALGVDYVTTKRINSLEFAWSNAAIQRYFPGSGVQDGFNTAGAIELTGGRAASITLDVDFDAMTDVDKVKNLTEGTIVLTLEASANRTMTLTLHRVRFSSYSFGSDQRGMNLRLTGTALFHSSNGYLTFVSKCGITGIGA